jgi:hypothetical protein
VRNRLLAPGDSTVVELTFKTRTYKTKLNKSATISSNDLSQSDVRIRVSAQVDAVPDTTLPFTYTPDKLEFTQDDKKLEVVLTNTGEQKLHLTQVGDIHGDLSMKLDDDSIKPGKKTKIKFNWKGEFQKENFERSVTFVVTGSGSTRFTVPFIVQGTDPTPEKKAPRRKPRTRRPSTASGKE